MFERSMTLHLQNRSDTAFAFSGARASSGPPPSADAAVLAPGQRLTVTARNPSGGCVGGFRLDGGGAGFAIAYDHPLSIGATTVAVQATPGWLAGADATTFPGHDSVANLNLYRGVASGSGWVAPLGLLAQPPFDNSQDFANSLYGPGVRGVEAIVAGYPNPSPGGYVLPADFSGGQLPGVAAAWIAQWLGQPGPPCPPRDAALLKWLAGYLRGAASNGPLRMWVPQIRYQPATAPAMYALDGYRRFDLVDPGGRWNAASVSAFCALLAGGAHFVAICATADLPGGVSVQPPDIALKSSGLATRHDPGNSHYAAVLNITGTYVQPASGDFAGRDEGLLQALLIGRTVNDVTAAAGRYNNFLQLEGWPAISSRHNADYDAHQATRWNVSTFGATPYSEKRATTVFLAPDGWTPQIYQTTRMMPYLGAYAVSATSPQPWLDTSLVSIAPNAPPLPARFIG
ncbi:hypothetical protein J5226_17420 [Lysobacter sp. K5869]|uniref:hypothetical protein n=1 Tax=Lysobacter sp. K5869 TaxID=2820808 RepID=UPI001C05F5DA|nr:hypothetical protein [Lysobacter sp. K5869]QWP75390.1 hypothetical protein J5226_17420 [Lysobacter sp. K5869]